MNKEIKVGDLVGDWKNSKLIIGFVYRIDNSIDYYWIYWPVLGIQEKEYASRGTVNLLIHNFQKYGPSRV